MSTRSGRGEAVRRLPAHAASAADSRVQAALWGRPPGLATGPGNCQPLPGDSRGLPQDLLKTSSGALNRGCAVLPDMHDAYETPADHRPWQARPTEWAAPGPRQVHRSEPAAPPADAQAGPPRWSGLGLSQDPV